MKKGQIIEKVKIRSLGYGGMGIATAEDGKKILVKGALPDSVVDVKIVKKRRDYVQAHIVQVHEVDEKWLDGEVVCPHYFFAYGNKDKGVIDHHRETKVGCGGCKRQVMSYEKQLQLKQDLL